MTILAQSWWKTDKNDWFLMFFVAGSLASAGLLFFLTGVAQWASFNKAVVVLFSGLVFSHALLRSKLRRKDRWLFPLIAMLLSLGLIFVFRLVPALLVRHLSWLMTGLALCLIFSRINYRYYEKYCWYLGFVGLVLLAATYLFGQEINGARNWLAIKGLSWEPSELVKLFFIIFTAGTANQKRFYYLRYIFWFLALILLALQRDFGTALIFFATLMAMQYVTGEKPGKLLAGMGLGVAGGMGGFYGFSHLRVRFAVWLNPWADPNGSGYQMIQSLSAYRAGGLTGTGIGLGHPQLIPAVATDFIYSALGEEMGLLGTVGVLIIFLLVVIKGADIALDATGSFGMILATGIFTVLGVEALVIAGGVTKLIPMTGIVLPFVSYGGSSLITSLLMLGVIFNIASCSIREEV